jgi:serine phosphatase RsbU (regulator of sigma subunit)
MGGMSLLIFNKKENSFNMILMAILLFGMIQVAQYFIDPVYPIIKESKSIIYFTNIIFIFGTNFILSYVLRYSGEEFEQKLQYSNALLARKNKDLTDSITYAKRIQLAVLPQEQLKNEWRKYVFVLFEPKEIVSGDFYWIYPFPDRFLFAVVDGSGHGVSGALVSIMAHTMLTQCVEEYRLREVDDIIVRMKMLIRERKEKWNDSLADNMEISLCSYEWNSNKLSYSSNGNALYLIKHIDNVLPEDGMKMESDDRYVMKEIRNPHSFIKKSLSDTDFLSGSHFFGKDDMLYLATNGMSSQLGGPKGKKLKSRRLKDLLMSVQHLSLTKQRHIINDVAFNWRGKFERTDDITLMGFRI